MRHQGSWKGHTFVPEDAPRPIRRDPSRCKAWCDEQTERYRIVARDPAALEGKREMIAEELEARALARLSPKARRAAGLIARLPAEVRRELLSAFDEHGMLKVPFVSV